MQLERVLSTWFQWRMRAAYWSDRDCVSVRDQERLKHWVALEKLESEFWHEADIREFFHSQLPLKRLEGVMNNWGDFCFGEWGFSAS